MKSNADENEVDLLEQRRKKNNIYKRRKPNGTKMENEP